MSSQHQPKLPLHSPPPPFGTVRANAEGLPSPQKKKQRGHDSSSILPYSGKQGWFSKKGYQRNINEDPNKSKSISGELKAKSNQNQ